MNKKIVIGILKREVNTDYENDYYKKAITTFDAVPLMIDYTNIEDLDKCSGLLLTGGDNKEELDDVFIDYAIDHKIPLLGICQGMQSMAVYKSDLDIVEIGNEKHQQAEKYIHGVELLPSKLEKILGKKNIRVNSHHKQTVLNSKFFKVVGMSDDHLIEAVENPKHPFQIGVQWHPERMLDYDDDSRILIKHFIEESSKI